jgi:hypothetical protein
MHIQVKPSSPFWAKSNPARRELQHSTARWLKSVNAAGYQNQNDGPYMPLRPFPAYVCQLRALSA